ncbi:MAG: hypothetical protein QF444_03945, partial [Phycisphaerales bacterium]|nr:hypothetical protein [Phycisphaerales bacterium]
MWWKSTLLSASVIRTLNQFGRSANPMRRAYSETLTHSPAKQQLLLWSGLLLVAFTWIFWDFLQRQVQFAIKQQADWGHTLVIP